MKEHKYTCPDSKVHGAHLGPRTQVGPMDFALWVHKYMYFSSPLKQRNLLKLNLISMS